MPHFRRHFRYQLLLSALPALIMLVVSLVWAQRYAGQHYLHYTGMLQGDQPSYTAYARAIFNRGNGILYANPFDYDPTAPMVLFNLGYFVLGWLIRLCGDHPVPGWEVWRCLWGTAAFALWAALVRRVLHGRGMRWWTWLAGAFGGGMAWIFALWRMAAFSGHTDVLHQAIKVEENYGWWCLNFFRQGLYPLELSYHALFLAAVFCYVSHRRVLLGVLVLCLWATHPITAMLTTSIVGAACALDVFVPLERRERNANVLLFVALGFIALGATCYYRIYLPSFPSIDAWIKQTLSFVPHLAWQDYIPAYGPLLLSAALALLLPRLRRWLLRDHAGRIVGLWGLLVWCWSNNDALLFHPIQPLHFMRGHLYLWLVLVTGKAADLYRHDLRAHLAWSRRRAAMAAFAALLLLLPDNILFVARLLTEAPKTGLLVYTQDAAEVQQYFAGSAGERAHRVIVCMDQWLGVRLVMQGERVFASESFLTPSFEDKAVAFVHLDHDRNFAGMKALGMTDFIFGVGPGAPEWIANQAIFTTTLQNRDYIVGKLR